MQLLLDTHFQSLVSERRELPTAAARLHCPLCRHSVARTEAVVPHLRRELKEARARRDELQRELDALRGERRAAQGDLGARWDPVKYPRGLVFLNAGGPSDAPERSGPLELLTSVEPRGRCER